jgi:hypothetical protein
MDRDRVLAMNATSLETFFERLQWRVTTNPQYTILFRAHPESPPPQGSLQQLPHRTEVPLTKIEKLSTTIPTTVEDGQAQVKLLGSAAPRLQAELAIAQERLHQALTR